MSFAERWTSRKMEHCRAINGNDSSIRMGTLGQILI